MAAKPSNGLFLHGDNLCKDIAVDGDLHCTYALWQTSTNIRIYKY